MEERERHSRPAVCWQCPGPASSSHIAGAILVHASHSTQEATATNPTYWSQRVRTCASSIFGRDYVVRDALPGTGAPSPRPSVHFCSALEPSLFRRVACPREKLGTGLTRYCG